MRLSELQLKDIISVKSGKCLGKIIDVEINNEGFITGIYIEEKNMFRNIFKGSNDSILKISEIIKIGEDVILVNIW